MRFLLLLLTAFLMTGVARGAVKEPTVIIGDVRGGAGSTITVPVTLADFPPGARAAEFAVDFGLTPTPALKARPGADLPTGSTISSEPLTTGTLVSVGAPAGGFLPSKGEIVVLSFAAPDSIALRRPISLTEPRMISATETSGVGASAGTFATSLFHSPAPLFAFLAGLVAMVLAIAQWQPLQGFFKYFPPLIFMYFIPMITTTVGITPDQSPLYAPFMSRVLLPAVLVLLLLPSDVRGIGRLGFKALFTMIAATAGIVAGAVGAFALFSALMPGYLPPGSWKAVAALSATWIGGSANLIAVGGSLDMPPGFMGSLIVVDTVVAYTWLGVLVSLAGYQKRIDAAHGADDRVVEEISSRLGAEREAHQRAPRTADLAFMIGLAFVISQLCFFVAPTINGWYVAAVEAIGRPEFKQVINATAWAILLITGVSLLLSMTPLRRLEYCGASSLGNVGLYLLLTGYGAQANLTAVKEVPVFIALGATLIVIHCAILYVAMRLVKAPLFLASTSSMACVGGTGSTPIVAAAYHPSMAPVGLLLAVLGGVLGTPVALFIVATITRLINPA